MDGNTTLAFYGLGAAAVATSVVTLKKRLQLSQAKHRSLAGHARMSRWLAGFVPFYEYSEERFFCSDDAPAEIAARRRDGFAGCRRCIRPALPKRSSAPRRRAKRFPICNSPTPIACRSNIAASCARICRRRASCNRRAASRVTDLDGNRAYDLTGSYGVNVLGYDFYKGTMERGAARVRELGPVLGPYHPVIVENAELLKEISGLDEVSFHMSGTEAVMQAVRLARYHTRRSHLVRFCGAYHGWWGDVQPGVGNPVPAHETYTLNDMSEDTLRVLRTRQQYRLRPGQSAAGAASECFGAERFLAGRQRPQRAFRQGRLRRMAQAPARDLHRAQYRADLRRGLCRLPPRQRRRAGLFRRPRRPRHLRQDARRRTCRSASSAAGTI